MADILLL